MVTDHTSPVIHIGNLPLVPTWTKHAPTPRTIFGIQRQTDPAVVLGHLILPLSRQPWSRGERFRLSGYTATSAYRAHKHQHAIGMFNTCSQVPTPRSIADTGGGYQTEASK
jgi:hypothetical protein